MLPSKRFSKKDCSTQKVSIKGNRESFDFEKDNRFACNHTNVSSGSRVMICLPFATETHLIPIFYDSARFTPL